MPDERPGTPQMGRRRRRIAHRQRGGQQAGGDPQGDEVGTLGQQQFSPPFSPRPHGLTPLGLIGHLHATWAGRLQRTG